MIIKIFTGPLNYTINQYTKNDSEYIIGVDQGCEFLIKHGIPIDLAIGDFDSTNLETSVIEKHAQKVIIHSSVKDYTDTFLAVEEALNLQGSTIVIYGGLGGRLDHSYANLKLLKKGNISIHTQDTVSYVLRKGKYDIIHDYKYISFFALETVRDFTLRGFAYEIDLEILDVDNPLCISNQGNGVVEFSDGELLVIISNEN